MRTLVIVLLLTGLAYAGNPDQRTSLTISGSGGSEKGDYSVTDLNGLSVSQDHQYDAYYINADLVVPSGENISIIGGISYGTSNSEGKANSYFYKNKSNYSGVYFSFGVKFYFSK